MIVTVTVHYVMYYYISNLIKAVLMWNMGNQSASHSRMCPVETRNEKGKSQPIV